VSSRDSVCVELASDLGEASSARVLETDALDDAPRERWRPARGAVLAGIARRLDVLLEEALELGNWDEALAPGRLHRPHGGDDAAVDGRDADAEHFGRLLPAVREAVGLLDLLQLTRRCPDALRLDARLT